MNDWFVSVINKFDLMLLYCVYMFLMMLWFFLIFYFRKKLIFVRNNIYLYIIF